MTKKLETQELENLKSLLAKLDQIRRAIGEIEEKKFEYLLADKDTRMLLNTSKKELEDKYGRITIDTETGEITKVEEPVEA